MSTSCSTTLNNTDTINTDTINTDTRKHVQDLNTLQKQYEKYFKKAVPEEYEDDGAWIRKQVRLKKHRLLYAKYYGKTLVGRWANDVAWMRSKIIKARKKKEAQPSPRITMDEDLPGWTIRSVIRENGKQAGQTYKMYYSPSGQCYRSRVQALRALQAEHDHAEALVDNADGVRKTGKRKHSDMTRDTRTNENNLSEQNTFQEMEYSDETVEDPDATLTEIDVSEDETENNAAPLDQMPMTDEEMQQKLHKDFQEAKGKYGDFILAECLKHRPDIARKLDMVHAAHLMLSASREMMVNLAPIDITRYVDDSIKKQLVHVLQTLVSS